ncbi:MAG TPA: hypothetical protein DD733_04625 [Clostridiales bacterium]|nr:hypothetical protein [Clostridiales bacterium]
MKKLIIVLSVLMLIIAFSACEKEGTVSTESDNSEKSEVSEISVVSTEESTEESSVEEQSEAEVSAGIVDGVFISDVFCFDVPEGFRAASVNESFAVLMDATTGGSITVIRLPNTMKATTITEEQFKEVYEESIDNLELTLFEENTVDGRNAVYAKFNGEAQKIKCYYNISMIFDEDYQITVSVAGLTDESSIFDEVIESFEIK